MSESIGNVERPPAALRAVVRHELAPVRPLRAPAVRALVLLPMGVLLLAAAPWVFQLRADAPRLGWLWLWGASTAQVGIGLAIVAAACVDAVPGRSWSVRGLTAWLLVPLVVVTVVTLATFAESPTRLRGPWWTFGAMCFAGSLASALPAVLLGAIVAVRAYVTRPLATGALVGLGGGIMADAGWRLFCHFSEPDHVLMAHLGGVLASALAGALALVWMASGPARR